jgi:AAA15 family ATPase/GTPase
MLINFKVKNFLSFKEEQNFTMVASSDNTHLQNTFTSPGLPNYRLLSVATVYGANASGKTNFIKALSFVEWFVTNSYSLSIGSKIPLIPFRLDAKSEELPTEFEITFIHDKVRYQYGFSLDSKKVIEEWLYAYPKNKVQKWFTRSLTDKTKADRDYEYEYDWGEFLKGEKEAIKSITRPSVLFLSKGAESNHKQLSKVYEWFKVYLDVYLESQRLNPASTADYIKNFPEMREKINDFLGLSDLGILNFETIEKDYPGEGVPEDLPEKYKYMLLSTKVWEINLYHRTDNPDVTGKFSLGDESKGTERLFALAAILFIALEVGGVLVLDELDSSLHPILVRSVIEMFQDPEKNKNCAQLIFNTHDTTLLDQSLFRRDQIWFAEKDKGGASHLYPLSDFRPRNSEALQKNYLQGRYGAIPVVGHELLTV